MRLSDARLEQRSLLTVQIVQSWGKVYKAVSVVVQEAALVVFFGVDAYNALFARFTTKGLTSLFLNTENFTGIKTFEELINTDRLSVETAASLPQVEPSQASSVPGLYLDYTSLYIGLAHLVKVQGGLSGTAKRMHKQHNNPNYRARNPRYHYRTGYVVSNALCILLGI
jgi:hypothetical protein